MIALPSRGSGEDVIAAALGADGDWQAGLWAVPSPASPTRSQLPLCWWVFRGVMHKEISRGKTGVVLHPLSEGSQDPIMRLPGFFPYSR